MKLLSLDLQKSMYQRIPLTGITPPKEIQVIGVTTIQEVLKKVLLIVLLRFRLLIILLLTIIKTRRNF